MPNIRRWNSCVASTSLERAATYQARFRYRLLADMIILFPWSPHPWRRMRGDQQAACQIAPRGPADAAEAAEMPVPRREKGAGRKGRPSPPRRAGMIGLLRWEERRVGQECASAGRFPWTPDN